MSLDRYIDIGYDEPRIPGSNKVTEYTSAPLLGQQHPCDRIVVNLLPETATEGQGDIVLASAELILGQNEYVVFENGRLKIDPLGLVANTFGRRSGNFKLDIAGYRSAIYRLNLEEQDDEGNVTEIPFTTIEKTATKNVILSTVRITEISSTRKEVRVEADESVGVSFAEFQLNNKPGVLPNEVYWMYENPDIAGGTVYFSTTSDMPDYDISNDHAFSSEEEYFEHREARGYPEDFSQIERREADGKTPVVKIRPVSDNRIWPCLLRFRNTTRPDETTIVATSNWINHPITRKNNKGEEVDRDTIIFRLPQGLPENFVVNSTVEIIQEIMTAYQIPVNIDLTEDVIIEFGQLRGPNLDINTTERTGNDTILKSFDDIVGSNTNVRNQLLNSVISGSNSIEQNYDFRKFDNFIHFSSAEERLKNFRYKLTLIEHYASKSFAVSDGLIGKAQSAATASEVFVNNKTFYDKKAENIKAGFDNFEKYLFFTSHSTETIDSETFPAATWPKQTSEKDAGSYTLFSVTSSEATTWYNERLVSASVYDASNVSTLRNVVPTHIKSDPLNDPYVLFFDMIGQHFDNLFYDIKALEEMHERNEDVNIGISKDMIYDLAKSFGWTLQSGFDSSELWSALLGTDESGVYQASGSGETLTFVKKESKSHKDIERQTWKRIVNNLPLLLKTKGTSRGLRALLATYGIPDTILRIQEYGGPTKKSANNLRQITKFNNALNFSGSTHLKTYHTSIDYDDEGLSLTSPGSNNRYLSMYEFRIDTTVTESMHLVSSNEQASTAGPGSEKWILYLEPSSSATGSDSPSAIAAGSASAYSHYGRLTFVISGSASEPARSCSTDYAPFYDNDWWNISFGVTEHPVVGTSANTIEIRYAAASEHSNGRITYSGSASRAITSTHNNMWANQQYLHWGGTGSANNNDNSLFTFLNAYSGSMQEIRGWAEYISTDAFHQHTLAPTSIVGDTVQMAYNDLFLRIPLGTDNNIYNVYSGSQGGVNGGFYFDNWNPSGSIPNSYNSQDGYTTAVSHLTYRPVFHDWPQNSEFKHFSPKTETYYVQVPNTAGPKPHASKIRIEDNVLRGNQLSRVTSFEESSFDSNPLDSEDITVALSPADQIDTDISMQFGGFDLDDYIGDPRDAYNTEYTSLRDTKNLYFKKFSSAYNVWEFIKLLNSMNKGLFRQIEAMLPARADAVVGIEIRPNLLERTKAATPASMSQEIQYHTGSVRLIGHTGSLSADANSKQTFQGSEFTHLNTILDIGKRSSQQRVSGSDTYGNRFDNGSEYIGVTFSEPTLSAITPYISESRRAYNLEEYIQIPTYNQYNTPGTELNTTGSGWVTVFEDNFTSFVTHSATPGSPSGTDQVYGPDDIGENYRLMSGGSSRQVIAGGGVQFGDDSGNDMAWVQWNNPMPIEPNTLYKMTVIVSQSLDTDGDSQFYSGFGLFTNDGVSPTASFQQISLGGTSASFSSAHYFVQGGKTLPLGVDQKYIGYVSTKPTNDYKIVSVLANRFHSSFDGNSDHEPNRGGITPIGHQVQSGPHKGKRMTHFTPMFLFNYNGDDGQSRITHLKVEALTSAYVDVNPQYVYSPSQRRLLFDGCKMISADFNAPSPNTIDGGPVAEFQLVNPNQIIVDPVGAGPIADPSSPTGFVDSFGSPVSPINQGGNNSSGPVAQQIIVR